MTQPPMESKGSPGGFLSTIRFSEIFPMEEITHFQRVINGQGAAGPSKLLSQHASSNGEDPRFSDRRTLESEWDSDSDDSSNIEVFSRPSENYDSDILDLEPGTSSSNNSIPEETNGGHRPHAKEKKKKNKMPSQGYYFEESAEGGTDNKTRASAGASSHPEPPPSFMEPFVIDVKRADVILDAIVFFSIVAEAVTDFTLAIWHYHDDMKWGAGLTWLFILLGAGSVLQQFNYLEQEQIKRLFDKGKRIRILINCFPPLAPIISSFQCIKVGFKSTRDPMVSSQYVEVENFTKNISKTQSVFQSAPQAALQLLLFLESLDEGSIGLWKGFFSLTNVVVSVVVMTNSSLPSKAENFDVINKMGQTPSQRLFIGIRMFSSFLSRVMGVTALFLCVRCLLGPENTFSAALLSLALMTVPRVLFSLVDFARQVVVGRQRRSQQDDDPRLSQQGHGLLCYEVFLGFMVTILFPVGYPVWLFWFVWGETALFIILNNIVGWSKGCLVNALNASFTGLFLVLFIIIPIIVPYVRQQTRQRRVRNRVRKFQRQQQRLEQVVVAAGDPEEATTPAPEQASPFKEIS